MVFINGNYGQIRSLGASLGYVAATLYHVQSRRSDNMLRQSLSKMVSYSSSMRNLERKLKRRESIACARRKKRPLGSMDKLRSATSAAVPCTEPSLQEQAFIDIQLLEAKHHRPANVFAYFEAGHVPIQEALHFECLLYVEVSLGPALWPRTDSRVQGGHCCIGYRNSALLLASLHSLADGEPRH